MIDIRTIRNPLKIIEAHPGNSFSNVAYQLARCRIKFCKAFKVFFYLANLLLLSLKFFVAFNRYNFLWHKPYTEPSWILQHKFLILKTSLGNAFNILPVPFVLQLPRHHPTLFRTRVPIPISTLDYWISELKLNVFNVSLSFCFAL